MSTAGDLGLRGTSGYTQSLVFDVTLTEDWQYVLQSDWVAIQADAVNAGVGNDQIGVNQYLFYTYNDCLTFGGRFEWWKSDGVSFFAATAGLNYKPHANVTIRPEYRYDWQGNLVNPVNNNPLTNVSTFGIDAIFVF